MLIKWVEYRRIIEYRIKDKQLINVIDKNQKQKNKK